MKARIYSLLLLCGALYPLCSQEAGFHELEPRAIDRGTLAKQHYDKKGYSVVTGELPPPRFTHPRWVVLDTALLPPGTSLALPSGVSVFFEPDAVLAIEGSLRAAGGPDKPVVLARVPEADMLYKADNRSGAWRGIHVGPGGSLSLKHAVIRGAEDGITTEGPCDSLELADVAFEEVGDALVDFGDKTIYRTPRPSFTLDCGALAHRRSPARRGRPGLKALSTVAFGAAAALAAAGGILDLAAYRTDRKVNTATDHHEAQDYSDSATRLYRSGNALLVASGTCLLPAISFRVAFGIGKRK